MADNLPPTATPRDDLYGIPQDEMDSINAELADDSDNRNEPANLAPSQPNTPVLDSTIKKYDPITFAQAIRRTYPGRFDKYKDDFMLAKAIAQIDPRYANRIDFGPQKPLEPEREKNTFGSIASAAGEGFREMPNKPDATKTEKIAHLVGEVGLPATVAAVTSAIPAAGPVAAPYTAAAASAVQKVASRTYEALAGKEGPNQSALRVAGDVVLTGLGEKASQIAAKHIAKNWEAFKAGTKEGAARLFGRSTGAGKQTVKTYIENASEAKALGGVIPSAEKGIMEGAYAPKYRAAITPEGTDEPLKLYTTSLADKLKTVNPTPEQILGEADRVVNGIASENATKHELINMFLRLKAMSSGAVPADAKALGSIKKTLEAIKTTKSTPISLQDGLDALQIVNEALRSGVPKAKATHLAKVAGDLVHWLEANGLPNIKEGMRVYSVGKAGETMNLLMPVMGSGALEPYVRAGVTAVGKVAGGPAGAALALGIQSPRVAARMIDAGLLAGKGLGKLGHLAAKTSPASSQALMTEVKDLLDKKTPHK